MNLLRNTLRVGMVGALALSTCACTPLTQEEAEASLEEARLYSQALSLIGTSVEINENFSIGQAVEDSIDNLADFYESQLPCAGVELEDGALVVDYGVRGSSCVHQGMTFSGRQTVSIVSNEARQVIVEHEWTDIENGEVSVSGTATVVWHGDDDPSRHITYDLSWTRISDGREAEGSGERLQQPLDGDLREGFTVSGRASWTGESGQWELDIDGVEMRWIDPVPQAGRYHLATPFDDKSLSLEFERSASERVTVQATSGYREYSLDVRTPE